MGYQTYLSHMTCVGARSKKQEAAAASSGGVESGESKIELIKRPREYTVVFGFPEVATINPPILEVSAHDSVTTSFIFNCYHAGARC